MEEFWIIHLIWTQNMFKFDLKHGYYHTNKYFGFSWKIGNDGYFFLTVFASRTWLSPVPVWKDYSSFNKLLVRKTGQDSLLVGWVPQSIRILIWSNSQFIFCTRNFAKMLICYERWETNWQTQKVIAELQIVLDLTTKTLSL